LLASVVGEGKVERAAVGVDVPELAVSKEDCGGAARGGLGADSRPDDDLVENESCG
jgi:hypothetical protein